MAETKIAYERFTDRSRKVMNLAHQEARQLNHEYVGTEHVLLGLAKKGSGVAGHVLRVLDVTPDKIREEIARVVEPQKDEAVAMGRLPQTPRLKECLAFALEEAKALNHNYVGTEHLLLGICREGQNIAAQVLKNLGVSVEKAREEVLALLGTGEKPAAPDEQDETTGADYIDSLTVHATVVDVLRKRFCERKLSDMAMEVLQAEIEDLLAFWCALPLAKKSGT